MEKNMASHQNNYRYERKYILDISNYSTLVNELLSEGMEVHHPTRFINNVYFDSLSLKSFVENIEGENKRNKYRLRWYGERFSLLEPTFEIKIKRDNVNRKESIKISKIDFKSFNDIEELHNNLLASLEEKNSLVFIEMINKIPTLLNGYNREYFVSKDGLTRLTIDRNLFFYNFMSNQNNSIHNKMIIEVKYPTNVTPSINFDKYKLILGKSSKYVSGIELTSLQ